jgi:hypothetical protein
MTATVETVSEQLDLAAIMPTEKIMPAVVRTVTLSETDLGKLSKNSIIQEKKFKSNNIIINSIFYSIQLKIYILY